MGAPGPRMRAVLVALGLLLLLLPAAPPAAACHPSLHLEVPAGPVGTAAVTVDMGCDHLPPWTVCAGMTWALIPAPPTTVCAPMP